MVISQHYLFSFVRFKAGLGSKISDVSEATAVAFFTKMECKIQQRGTITFIKLNITHVEHCLTKDLQ